MRGSDERTGELFSYVDLEKPVPAKHPLRLVRSIVNEVLASLDSDFSNSYADSGQPSIPPERLLFTSSASARTLSGTVSLSALAVLRLITNSNFTDCTTGRSAGFSPLRIRLV